VSWLWKLMAFSKSILIFFQKIFTASTLEHYEEVVDAAAQIAREVENTYNSLYEEKENIEKELTKTVKLYDVKEKELQDTIDSQEKEIKELKSDIHDLERKCESLDDDLASMTDERDDLQKIIDES
jgi:peptidoglycan hydrolase CwlO-like protein